MSIEAGHTTYWQAKRGIVQSGLVLSLDAAVDASYISGTTWYDLSGGGDNGTLTNGPTFNRDNGGIIEFDGSDDYIDLGSITLGSSISLSVWIYLKDSSSIQHIIDSSSNSWHFAIYGDQPYFYNGSTYPQAQAIQLNTWYNLVLSFTTSSWYIYINGSLDLTADVSTSSFSTNNIHIGRWQSGGRNLDGDIGSVQFYNRAITADEVLQNYNATKGRFK